MMNEYLFFGDVVVQIICMLENVKVIVEVFGVIFDDVVMFCVYFMKCEDFLIMNEVYGVFVIVYIISGVLLLCIIVFIGFFCEEMLVEIDGIVIVD